MNHKTRKRLSIRNKIKEVEDNKDEDDLDEDNAKDEKENKDE